MKKLLNLLLILPLAFFAVSCDDDDNNDMPEVTTDVKYSGAVEANGALYVVQGDILSITSVDVTPNPGAKPAVLGPVTFAWDGQILGTAVFSPYTMSFDTSVAGIGAHLLQLSGNLAQEGKPISSINIEIKVIVVASADQIPGYSDDSSESGTFSVVRK